MILVEHAYVPCCACSKQLVIHKDCSAPLGVFEVDLSWDKYEDPIIGLTFPAYKGKIRLCLDCLGELKRLANKMDQPIEWLPPETLEKE